LGRHAARGRPPSAPLRGRVHAAASRPVQRRSEIVGIRPLAKRLVDHRRHSLALRARQPSEARLCVRLEVLVPKPKVAGSRPVVRSSSSFLWMAAASALARRAAGAPGAAHSTYPWPPPVVHTRVDANSAGFPHGRSGSPPMATTPPGVTLGVWAGSAPGCTPVLTHTQS
jgi:hypothetical protein